MSASVYPPPIVFHVVFWLFVAIGVIQLTAWLTLAIRFVRKCLR